MNTKRVLAAAAARRGQSSRQPWVCSVPWWESLTSSMSSTAAWTLPQQSMEAQPTPTAPGTRRLWSLALCLAVLFASRGTALAQDHNRGGFTLLVNAGYGVQHDTRFGRSGTGKAGLNLGIGGFLTRDLALLFRASATSAETAGILGDLEQASGVVGATLQYWASDRIALEAGAGFGFVEDIYGADSPGLILATTATLFNRGKHSLQAGVEYALAFRQSRRISNVGFTIGYQFL